MLTAHLSELVLFVLGGVLGSALGFRGWTSAGGVLAIGGGVGTLALNLFSGSEKAPDAFRSAFALVQEYHFTTYAGALGAGGLVGLVLTLAAAGLLVFSSSVQSLRRHGRVDAVPAAGRQTAYLLAHGITAYLAKYSEGSVSVATAFQQRRLALQQQQLRLLRRALREGVTERRAKDLMEQAGTNLLTSIFESTGTVRDFRLAVFAVDSEVKELQYYACVNNGDWSSHNTSLSLPLADSFLGAAIAEGTSLVFPRDRGAVRKKPFRKRSASRYKAFLAVPLPPDVLGQQCWGGLSIDHVGDASVFTNEHIEAVADFAQFVDAIHTLVK